MLIEGAEPVHQLEVRISFREGNSAFESFVAPSARPTPASRMQFIITTALRRPLTVMVVVLAIALGSFTFGGTASADYAVDSTSGCRTDVSLPAGQGCTLVLRYTPTQPGTRAATLAIAAAKQALERSGLSPQDIACCVCATLSAPDATPSVACQVQRASNTLSTCLATWPVPWTATAPP